MTPLSDDISGKGFFIFTKDTEYVQDIRIQNAI